MVNPVMFPANTNDINQSLYLRYFAKINGIPEDKLHISPDNSAFDRYQKNDARLARMRDTLVDLESQMQEIDQMLPGLIERTKTKATEQEVLQKQVARLQSLKMAIAEFNKKYPVLRTEATNAFNASLLAINNAPGEASGVAEITPKELARPAITALFNKIASAYTEIGNLKKEIGDMHHIVTDYHTTFGPPKLREKVAAAATTTVAPTAPTTSKLGSTGA